MTDRLTELHRTTHAGVYAVYQDGEELGLIDVFDDESIEDDTLLALATDSAHSVMDRQGGK